MRPRSLASPWVGGEDGSMGGGASAPGGDTTFGAILALQLDLGVRLACW